MIHTGIFSDEISQDLEEAAKVAKASGLERFEIRGVWGKNVSELTRPEIAKVKKIMKDYGLGVSDVGSPFLKCTMAEYDTHMKFLDKLIYEAHQWDTRLIRSFALTRVEPVEKTYEEFLDKIRPTVKIAEKESVVFAIEMGHGSYVFDFEEGKKLKDVIPSDSLKYTWHVRRDYEPEKYRLCRGQVAHLHVSDSAKDPSNPRGARTTYIGEGDTPFRAIFRDLLKDGFEGTASIEAGAVHWKDAGSDVIQRNARNLAAIIKDAQGTR